MTMLRFFVHVLVLKHVIVRFLFRGEFDNWSKTRSERSDGIVRIEETNSPTV